MIEQIDAPAIRATLLRLSDERAPRTFCPSEAARALAPDWRPLMDAVRDEATALADEGVLDVTQGGLTVDARSARGPIRIRRAK